MSTPVESEAGKINIEGENPKVSAARAEKEPRSQGSTMGTTEAVGKEGRTLQTHTKSILTSSKPPVQDQSIGDEESSTRQVIAVSASKGPSAFFNLARKFLVTDEACDLSALEGAIVSAVDAAHLLERSKLATIVRIRTSYVAVGPKRKKNVTGLPSQVEHPGGEEASQPTVATSTGKPSPATLVAARIPATPHLPSPATSKPPQPKKGHHAGGKELRRARIIITVKRTEDYKRWLEDNPLQEEDFSTLGASASP